MKYVLKQPNQKTLLHFAVVIGGVIVESHGKFFGIT